MGVPFNLSRFIIIKFRNDVRSEKERVVGKTICKLGELCSHRDRSRLLLCEEYPWQMRVP